MAIYSYPLLKARSLYVRNRVAFIVSLVFVGIVVALIVYKLLSGGAALDETAKLRTVEVASVSELSGGEGALVVVGELSAASQADLRAQKTGRVTAVYAKAGSFVAAGAIIAEVENANERARVLSAQGQLQAAQAQLALVRSGARPEDRIAIEAAKQSAQGSLSQAQISAANAFKQGFSAAQEAVEGKADSLFRDVETTNPKFTVSTQEFSTSQDIENQRAALATLINQWESESASVGQNDANLSQKLVNAQNRLENIQAFLDDVARAVAAQTERGVPQSTIDAQQATISQARGAVDGALAAIGGARTALFNATSGQAAASAQSETVESGARAEDISVAEASVTSARGSLAGAVADLDATRIRAPFAGTVSALSVNVGDFVTNNQPMAVVTNDRGNSYIVETFVGPTERSRIDTGAQATIEDIATGTVTSIAPGIDPATQKVRVEIALSGLPEELAPGQSVRVAIQTSAQSETTSLIIPLSALKLTPDGAFVFTVSASSTLVQRPVSIGQLSSDKVVVEGGLSPETMILVDARGRREGEGVAVAPTDGSK